MSGYITPEMKLWAFRAFLFVREVSVAAWNVGSALVSAGYNALKPNDYIFYDGYTLPVLASKYSTEGPGTPRVYWYYNPSNCVFFKNINSTGEPQRFPFLSMQLCFNGMNLYSLDEFVANQSYVGEMPPALVLVGAWCLATGIVLDRSISLSLRVIDEDGEDKYYTPWAYDWTTHGMSLMTNATRNAPGPGPVPGPVPGPYPIAGVPSNDPSENGYTFFDTENVYMDSKTATTPLPPLKKVRVPTPVVEEGDGFVDLSGNSDKND